MRATGGLGRVGVSILLLAAAGAGCRHGPDAPSLPEHRVSLRLKHLNGETFTLASLRGGPVLVTVFTTWSDPALMEAPLLREIYEENEGALDIVAIGLDEDPEMIRIFARTFDLPYIVARPHDAARLTGPEGPFGPISVIPTSILLDADGRIAARMDGVWSPGVLRAAVRALLSKPIKR